MKLKYNFKTKEGKFYRKNAKNIFLNNQDIVTTGLTRPI